MNYAKLQQDVNRLLNNMYAWIAFIPAFVSATAQNVSITLENANGTTTTTTHPNLAKWMQSVAAAVAGVMHKAIHVDSVNGNDANSGTLANPFKTIKAAVESMSPRSWVRIYLHGDNHIIDDNINGKFQKVEIRGGTGAGGKNSILAKVANNGSVNYLYGFVTISDIAFFNTDISYDLSGANTAQDYTYSPLFYLSARAASPLNVQLYGSKVSLPDNPLITLATSHQASSAGISVSIYNTEVNSAGTGSKLISLVNASCTLGVSSATLTGAITDWKELVSGVVRDADSGNPINLVSNINFSN